MSQRQLFNTEPEAWEVAARELRLVATVVLGEGATGEFDYLVNRIGEGVFVLTMHPQCIGKGSRMLMLERLIGHIKEHEQIEFKTLADVADEFRAATPLAN